MTHHYDSSLDTPLLPFNIILLLTCAIIPTWCHGRGVVKVPQAKWMNPTTGSPKETTQTVYVGHPKTNKPQPSIYLLGDPDEMPPPPQQGCATLLRSHLSTTLLRSYLSTTLLRSHLSSRKQTTLAVYTDVRNSNESIASYSCCLY